MKNALMRDVPRGGERASILRSGPGGNALLGRQPSEPDPREITVQALPRVSGGTARMDNLSTSGNTEGMGRSPSAPPSKIETQGMPAIRRPAQMKIDNFSTNGEGADLGADPGEPAKKTEPQQTPKVMPYRDHLRRGVEASGGKPGRTKSETYDALKKAVTPENLPQVAAALNLPDTASKGEVLQRAREMMRIAGKSNIAPEAPADVAPPAMPVQAAVPPMPAAPVAATPAQAPPVPMRPNALAANPEFDAAHQDFLAAFQD